MRATIWLALAASFWAASLASGQPSDSQAPITGNPKVELKGKIERVQVARGQGMPFLEVKSEGRTTRVILGSVRYLIEQDFNPKAGQEISVKGYKVGDDVVASEVALLPENKVLKLRDETGRPVWRRGLRGCCGCCGPRSDPQR